MGYKEFEIRAGSNPFWLAMGVVFVLSAPFVWYGMRGSDYGGLIGAFGGVGVMVLFSLGLRRLILQRLVSHLQPRLTVQRRDENRLSISVVMRPNRDDALSALTLVLCRHTPGVYDPIAEVGQRSLSLSRGRSISFDATFTLPPERGLAVRIFLQRPAQRPMDFWLKDLSGESADEWSASGAKPLREAHPGAGDEGAVPDAPYRERGLEISRVALTPLDGVRLSDALVNQQFWSLLGSFFYWVAVFSFVSFMLAGELRTEETIAGLLFVTLGAGCTWLSRLHMSGVLFLVGFGLFFVVESLLLLGVGRSVGFTREEVSALLEMAAGGSFLWMGLHLYRLRRETRGSA